MLRPCFFSEEDYEKGMKSTPFWTDKNFHEETQRHYAALDVITSCAKLYIIKNFEKIKDWIKLDVIIKDNTGHCTEYYNFHNHWPRKFNHIKERSEKVKKFLELVEPDIVLGEFNKRWEINARKKHNPIVSFTEAVLDPSDSDFSVVINDNDHLWINDDAIIEIANYMEQYLKEETCTTETKNND